MHRRSAAYLIAATGVTLLGACRCAPYGAEESRQAIDVHVHVAPGATERFAEICERAGVTSAWNLSGRPYGPVLGLYLEEARAVSEAHDDFELLVFSGVDWRLVDAPDFGELAADDLRRAVHAGARGLKISKVLGLGLQTTDGELVPVDTPRLDPLWQAAGALGVPVMIHTGDPLAFFQPPTDDNPRIEELRAHPSWSFYGDDYPSLEELLAARDRLVARHPDTTFVGVHVGGFPENLEAVAASMRKYPNLWIDVAARLPEIGRNDPENLRAFIEEFQDRILLGTDLQIGRRVVLGSAGDDEDPSDEDAVRYYQLHWRFFETRDRGIEHLTPIQGRWTIDAIGLSRATLDAIYRGNALRLLAEAGARE